MNEDEKIKVLVSAARNGGLAAYNTLPSLLHFICQKMELTDTFIREYQNDIYWKDVSSQQQLLDTNFLRQFRDKLDWWYVRGCGRTFLTDEQRKEFKEYFEEFENGK